MDTFKAIQDGQAKARAESALGKISRAIPSNVPQMERFFNRVFAPFQGTREDREKRFAQVRKDVLTEGSYIMTTEGWDPGTSVIAQQVVAPSMAIALAESPFMSFMEWHPVKAGEQAVYVTRPAITDISMREIHVHGSKANSFKIGAGNTIQPVTMYAYSSDAVEVPSMYPNWPAETMVQTDILQFGLSHGLEIHLDTDAKALMDAGLGTFPAGAYTYKDSRIQDFPTTNDIDLSGSITGITKELLATILANFLIMKNPVVEMLCNVLDWRDFCTNSVSVVTSAADLPQNWDPDTVSTITKTGTITNLFGQSFKLTICNVIPSGEIWVRTARPAGRFYYYVDEEGLAFGKLIQLPPEKGPNGQGVGNPSMMVMSYAGLIQPDTYLPNYAKVSFATS
jgi:hypothetical protein